MILGTTPTEVVILIILSMVVSWIVVKEVKEAPSRGVLAPERPAGERSLPSRLRLLNFMVFIIVSVSVLALMSAVIKYLTYWN